MTFMAILPYLIPVLQALWQLLKPTIRKLIEKLWEKVEAEIDEKINDLEVPKAEAKLMLFNTEARRIYAAHGKEISDADLNLVREVVHNKMSKKAKKRKRSGKSG